MVNTLGAALALLQGKSCNLVVGSAVSRQPSGIGSLGTQNPFVQGHGPFHEGPHSVTDGCGVIKAGLTLGQLRYTVLVPQLPTGLVERIARRCLPTAQLLLLHVLLFPSLTWLLS